MLFYSEQIAKLKAEHPNVATVKIASLAGAAWRAIPPIEKQNYIERSAEDKKRFDREYLAETIENGGVKLPVSTYKQDKRERRKAKEAQEMQ